MNNTQYDLFKLDRFRKIKDNSYNDKTTCLQYVRKYGPDYVSNPRFINRNKKIYYDQTYFTAGDHKDISKYGLLPVRYMYSDEKKIKNIEDSKEKIFKLYKNIDYHSINNTFNYMFNKFKKGIFIVIRDNKLIVYLPFSNSNYKNNWVKQTYFSEEEKNLLETKNYSEIKHILNKNILNFEEKYPDQFKYHNKINLNRDEWYANNCIFRNSYRKYEGELNTNIYKNMIEELLKDRKIPNVEFFINDRDFPLLKKDYTEPYDHLYDSEKIKIEKEYQVKKMCPIFSKSITNKFADILLPTNDDWNMVSEKFFTTDCSDAYHKDTWSKINFNWNTKKPVCIFRGGATGCGITIDNNMRLKAASMTLQYPDLLDAAIVDWKARPRKYMNQPIQIINTDELPFRLSTHKINNIEKSNYKYILNIDGYVSAFRLSSELKMGSVVLIVKSKYKLWFSDLLEEYVHYIPIKSDLKDLIKQIKWCIDNDDKCRKIAENSLMFYNKYLTKEGIFDYMQQKLNMIYLNKNFKNLLDVKKSKVNIAIISCFRDKGDGRRENERKIFIQLMNKLLEPYCNFKIYIIEQSHDGDNFNIGKLKNIGFEIASKESNFDNYVFTDIDTIPDYDLMNYIMQTYDSPVSIAYKGTRYTSKNIKTKKPFLGACIQMTKDVFTKINGYPNNFWGWGGEDDSLLNRIIDTGMNTIYYPKNGSIIDFEENENMSTINDPHVKYKSSTVNLLKYEKMYNDTKIWKENGINNLNYTVLKDTVINKNTVQIKVDLEKKKDEQKYPKWVAVPKNNYLKDMKTIKDKWYNIKIKYI